MADAIEPARSLPSEVLETTVRVHRRNWVLPAAAFLVALAGVIAARTLQPPLSVALGMFAVGFLFAPLAVLRNAFPHRRLSALRASREGLTVGTLGLIVPSQIEDARIIPRVDSSDIVVLRLRPRGSLSLEMRANESARFVSLLGVAAGQRRTTFTLMSSYLARLGVAYAPWALLATSDLRLDPPERWVMLVMLWIFSALPIAALCAWVLGFVRGRLVVGADGFSVRWLVRKRFYAFTDVKGVSSIVPFRDRFVIDTIVELHSGKRIRLRTPEAPVTSDQRGAESHTLHHHLVAAFERARRENVGQPQTAALLARGDRSGRAWLEHLDAVRQGGLDRYRVAALRPEALAEVVADVTSPADARVGAAAALVRYDGARRGAVRIAADACANPELRTVLLALSDAESDEAFATALARLPAERGNEGRE